MNTNGNKEKKRGFANARITPSTEDKIEQIIARDHIQKSDFIRKAIEFYLEHLEGKASDSAIELRLYRYNALTENRMVEQTPLRKFKFNGYPLVFSENFYSYEITDKVADALYKEFGVSRGWNNVYDVYHVLNLYYSYTNTRFVIQEKLQLYLSQQSYDLHPAVYGLDEKNGETFIECPFILERCKFVSDYREVVDNFSTFAHAQNLEDISYSMAADIGEDYSVLDQLFEPYHKF